MLNSNFQSSFVFLILGSHVNFKMLGRFKFNQNKDLEVFKENTEFTTTVVGQMYKVI